MKIIDALPHIKSSAAPEDLISYGFDACGIEELPSAVLWPESAGHIIEIMKFAHENDIGVVPRGAGTGMTGGAVPLKGAVVLSMERMNNIIDVDRENLFAVVEPGVINGRLQREVEDQMLFYPPDPASMNFCTIGGNVAENAGGPRALKYGVTRDYVMEIEAVLPGGDLINLGVKTRKGVVGYDVARLLVGSEGTLAVLTKVRLRLLPLPDDVVTLLCLFDDIESAGRSVSKITAARIVPRTLEFMDDGAINAAEKIQPVGIPAKTAALLLIELDGPAETIRKEAEKIAEICTSFGADVSMAKNKGARDKLWECRRRASQALYHICPKKISEDIVVPRNRIPEVLNGLRRLSEESGIGIVNFGHAGDGNIHVNLMVDQSDREERMKVERLIRSIFDLTLRLGGTISGEHGIGITKAPFIGMEIREREMNLMKGIKRLFDPKGILNPGKIFP